MTVKNSFCLEDIAKLLSVDSWEKIVDSNPDAWCDNYTEAFNQAIDSGYTTEEAETQAQAAESNASSFDFQRYKTRLLNTFELFLSYHNMNYREFSTKPYQYEICVERNWDAACDALRHTINGDGICGYYSSLKEFKDIAGSQSSRKVTLNHISWITRYADVYGVSSPKTLVSRN